MSDRFRIFALDKDQNKLGEVFSWQNLRVARIFNDVPTLNFSLVTTETSDLLAALAEDEIRQFLVTWNGTNLVTASVETQLIDRSGSGSVTVQCYCQGILQQLVWRRVYPDPDLRPGEWTSEYDSRVGVAETVIKAYLAANAGSGALTERRYDWLTIASDQARGRIVNKNGRLQDLLSFFQEIAEEGELGFAFDGYAFDVYEIEDRSGYLTLSAGLNTLRTWRINRKLPEANTIIAGGQGAGSAREFILAQDSNSVADYGRREWFYDYRSVETSAALLSASQVKLAEKDLSTAVSCTAQNTGDVTYLKDYREGDIVNIRAGGKTYTQVIRKMEIRAMGPNSAAEFVPTIGPPGAEEAQASNLVTKQMQEISERLANLETNQ